MIRLFDTHKIRETRELDGMWDFSANGKTYSLPVPRCWEQHPDLLNYRGRGTYKKTINIKKSGNIRLEFKGVSHTADVYLDGEKITHHYNAFTPFSAVVKNVNEGAHELRVDVDNSFGESSALHIPNDYYTYGGITRSAALEYLPDVYIERIRFTPSLKDGKWSAETEVMIKNLSETAKTVTVKTALAGAEAEREAEIPAASGTTVAFEQDFDGIKPWFVGEPNLYELTSEIFINGVPTDDLIERVGFRTVEVRDAKIFINDKPVYMKGFNRHEDYAVDGCAVSVQHMVQDMDLMQAANANAARTCHYPNDER